MVIATLRLANGETHTITDLTLDGVAHTSITSLVRAVKGIVIDACEHDYNTHKSFRNAKTARCSKCKLIIPRKSSWNPSLPKNS
jgi:hypothetical protein